MAFDGYIEFDGSELINISRTVQLSQVLGLDVVWTDPDEVKWVEFAVGGGPYTDITTAPWYDAGYPASAEFAGFIPLGMPGMDDSTLTSTTVEYITDGGHSGKPRNATQAIVASIAIVASTERGADYGKRWLDRRLRGTGGTTGAFCSGVDLRFYRWAGEGTTAAPPDTYPPRAHYRDVRLTRGAVVTRKRHTDCSATWLSTFTLTAGDPFVYGEPEVAVTGLGAPLVAPSVPPGVPTRINMALDPQARNSGTNWWTTLRWFGSSGAGTYSYVSGNSSPVGSTFRRKTWTTAPTGGTPNGDTGFQTQTLVGFTAAQSYAFSAYMRPSVAGKFARMRVQWKDGAGVNIGGVVDGAVVGLVANEWSRVPFIGVAPAGAAQAVIFPDIVHEVGSIAWAVGNTLDATGILIEQSTTLNPYFDGDSAPYYDDAETNWKVYGWAGTVNNSASREFEIVSEVIGDINEGGQVTMVQEDCPVYDYSPIYDPNYPALVPAPQPPDFYPDGWFIESGLNFVRRWVRLDDIEPSDLRMVPVIELTTNTDARGVRISIWPEDSDFGDQCDPLFTAIVSYLPAGLTTIIDGEAQVSYVWDGFSAAVRRADSLVYGTDATPMRWTAFNEGKMLVTLDTFLDGPTEQGLGSVRAEVAFVPKSD